MALTIGTVETNTAGRYYEKRFTITFDDSYVTNGEPFTKEDVGLYNVKELRFNQGEDGYVLHWDAANEKIIAYEAGADGAALDEVANATDLSGVVVEAVAVGH